MLSYEVFDDLFGEFRDTFEEHSSDLNFICWLANDPCLHNK